VSLLASFLGSFLLSLRQALWNHATLPKVYDRYMSATTTSPVSHVELLSGETSHPDWRVAYHSSGASAGLTYKSTVYGWAFLVCPLLPLHERLCCTSISRTYMLLLDSQSDLIPKIVYCVLRSIQSIAGPGRYSPSYPQICIYCAKEEWKES
jgi:hypothetical protein